MLQTHSNVGPLRVQILCGHAEIIDRAVLLEELALRCDQAGAMHWLQHFLAVPTFRGKRPYLMVGLDASMTITWAVLLYELTPLGLSTGIFSTDDISGFRSVIALAPERAEVAGLAAKILLESGAQIAMISFLKSAGGPARVETKLPACWATRDRTVLNTLVATDTYEATLMLLGKATRFNMRYYRRRLMRQMRYELVSDARGLFTEESFEALNATSLNPMAQDVMRLQYASACEARGGFLLGLRTEDGTWLGIVGGWRQGATTVLLWQINRAGFERNSLGKVMRGHFLEYEIERGVRKIVFYGGTPNSIQNSFESDTVEDLVAVQRSVKARLLSGLASLAAKRRRWMKGTNFIAATLHDHTLAWHETNEPVNR